MDPSLTKEVNAFKKQAMAIPLVTTLTTKNAKPQTQTVVSKQHSGFLKADDGKDKRRKLGFRSLPETLHGPMSHIRATVAASKAMGDEGQQKFRVLAKIIEHLKEKFFEIEVSPLSIDELLANVGETEIAGDTKRFLRYEALPVNPKVTVTEGQKYLYKPPLPCRDQKSLISFLKEQKRKIGGTLKDDITDSIPCAETILRNLLMDGLVTVIARTDRRDVVFFNGRSPVMKVDEMFKALYWSINVTSLDSRNIENYLRSQGQNPLMEKPRIKPSQPKSRKKSRTVVRKPRAAKRPKDNIHVADQLKNYGDGLEELSNQTSEKSAPVVGNKPIKNLTQQRRSTRKSLPKNIPTISSIKSEKDLDPVS